MITFTGGLWFPLVCQPDRERGAVQGWFSLNPMEEPGWMKQNSMHCNRPIHSFFWDQNTCLLIYVIQDVKRSLCNLKRLGRIWLAEGASNLGLRLIPLITFCNQRLSSQNSELESELRSEGANFLAVSSHQPKPLITTSIFPLHIFLIFVCNQRLLSTPWHLSDFSAQA